jgi:hypothetical protein
VRSSWRISAGHSRSPGTRISPCNSQNCHAAFSQISCGGITNAAPPAAAACICSWMRAARSKIIQQHEGLARRAADSQDAVIAHQHDLVRSEVAHQSRLFVEIDGDAFIVVEGLTVIEAHRELAERQQALLLAGDRDAGVGMGVQHAGSVVV